MLLMCAAIVMHIVNERCETPLDQNNDAIINKNMCNKFQLSLLKYEIILSPSKVHCMWDLNTDKHTQTHTHTHTHIHTHNGAETKQRTKYFFGYELLISSLGSYTHIQTHTHRQTSLAQGK